MNRKDAIIDQLLYRIADLEDELACSDSIINQLAEQLAASGVRVFDEDGAEVKPPRKEWPQ